jgi:hypothetical protein
MSLLESRLGDWWGYKDGCGSWDPHGSNFRCEIVFIWQWAG